MFNIRFFFRKLYKSITKQKINVVFVCHRPAIWSSLKTVFEACNTDKMFNVTIVAIPNKKQLPDIGLNHEIYETEGAEEFFKNYPCRVINGYNYNTKEWFDLKSLKPDYVFFQTPYNITRPRNYNSSVVCKYSKMCYVTYAISLSLDILNSMYQYDFFSYISILFTETKYHHQLIKKILKNCNRLKFILTGHPTIDNVIQYKTKPVKSDNWNKVLNNNSKRIIWTPRWTTNENNCSFFLFKDKLLEYVEKHKNIDFIFRPHPQAFLSYVADGDITENDLHEYIRSYDDIDNAKIDKQKEYLTTFYSSDILITDISSIIVEYFLTEKPIIYFDAKTELNEFAQVLSTGFYKVHSWEELANTLDMLMKGNDPLQETRKNIIKDTFYINPEGAGNTIAKYIKNDFTTYKFY